jgi:hypothetical protein
LTRDNTAIHEQNLALARELAVARDEIADLQTLAADDLAKHKAESVAAIRAAVIASDAKIDGLRIQLDDLEQYGRRKSIRVQNVPIVPGEDRDATQDLLLTSINATLQPSKIVLRQKDTIRFHRSSAAKDNRDAPGTKVSQCIVKLKNWRLRRQFQGLNTRMRKEEVEKTGGGCRVYHDLTKRGLALLNEARDLCKDGWFAYADTNSNLKLRKGERFLNFNTREELAVHARSLFPVPEGVADVSDISDLHEAEADS